AGYQHGYVAMEGDQRMGDNRFYYHAYIPEDVQIVLIESIEEQNVFLKDALQTLDANTHQIHLLITNPQSQAWIPNTTDVVILGGIDEIPRLLSRQIIDFLGFGGTLVIVPGVSDSAIQALGALQTQLNLPPFNPSPQSLGSPKSLDEEALSFSILRPVFNRESELGDLPLISRSYILRPRGEDEVVLRAEDGPPLLVRTAVGEGSVFFFTLPFNLQWSDLPLKGSFIFLWRHLSFWRSLNSLLSDVRVGESTVILMTPRQSIQTLTLVAPDGISNMMIPDLRTRSITLRDLDKPGIYTTHLTGGGDQSRSFLLQEGGLFSVNVPHLELAGKTLDRSALRSIFPEERSFILGSDVSIDTWVEQARFGRELWRPLLYLLIAVVIAEMIVSNVYHTPRRRDP
ncbi:hypothetical protein ACFLZR_01805, partial [Candidatus Neomarinimicrobiota bacterium]